MDARSGPVPYGPARAAVASWVGLAVGPLAAAAFFLPWAHGPGPLASESYSGFELVGFAGRLQALQLSIVEGGFLWLARAAILAVAVAATWQCLLSVRHRWHLAYRLSGWYLAAFAGTALAVGFARSGVTAPSPGLALLALAGAAWLVVAAAPSLRK